MHITIPKNCHLTDVTDSLHNANCCRFQSCLHVFTLCVWPCVVEYGTQQVVTPVKDLRKRSLGLWKWCF